MAIEKSFAPITCHIYCECRQSSLITLSITGEEMAVLAWEEGKRGLPSYTRSAQVVQPPGTVNGLL